MSLGGRYVISNPYSGYYVGCLAEVYYNSSWCDTGFIYADSSGGGWGVKCTQLNDDNLVVQVGNSGTLAMPTHGGSGVQNTDIQTALPCRVKVWKIAKI